jgi:hypothetical protein
MKKEGRKLTTLLYLFSTLEWTESSRFQQTRQIWLWQSAEKPDVKRLDFGSVSCQNYHMYYVCQLTIFLAHQSIYDPLVSL